MIPLPQTSTDADAPPHSGGDSYDDIEPLFADLARLDPDSPAHHHLREDIIDRCLPLAEHIAMRFAGRGELFDDLLQTARLGVVVAVDRFDPGYGAPFLAFAVPTVMGEVRRHFRDNTWALRVPRREKELQAEVTIAADQLTQELGRTPTARELAAELDVEVTDITTARVAAEVYNTRSLDMPVHDFHGEPAGDTVADTLCCEENRYDLAEDTITVAPLLAELDDAERRLLVWRFYDSLSQSAIARRLGVSQMTVSRMLSRLLGRLHDQAVAEPVAA
ncbi:SigB/SigF/SigG family RNA polymerase sigma factor [Nocardia thailandica]|uniref:SigB/SigF/SigG family RNA polymerase sigma factor n=1 Tax=Nocardia thailandica TaxID=257275 RepID=A0ABW6PU33_9NOCA